MSVATPQAFSIPRPEGVVLAGLRWDPPADTAVVGRVVVVHGLGEHGGRYDRLAEALTVAGYVVVAYDQRGHGRSPGSRGRLRTLEHHVDDLAAVRDEVVRRVDAPGPPVLFGHSFGGLVALRAVQTRSGEWAGLVLSAPWLRTSLPIPGWKRVLEPVLRRCAPGLTVSDGLRAEHLTRDAERARLWTRDPLVHHRVSAGLVATVEAAQRSALDGGLPRGLPALLLLPSDDPVTDTSVVARWAAGLRDDGGPPDVRVVPLEGRRHEPHNDRGRAEVFALLVQWLRVLRGAEQRPREWVSSSSGRPAAGAPAVSRDEPERDPDD